MSIIIMCLYMGDCDPFTHPLPVLDINSVFIEEGCYSERFMYIKNL